MDEGESITDAYEKIQPREDLQNWHCNIDERNVNSQDLVTLSNLRNVVIQKSDAMESMYKQKSRINWLNLGDLNTSYFHNMMKFMQNRNSISSLTSDDGREINGVDCVVAELCDFLIIFSIGLSKV